MFIRRPYTDLESERTGVFYLDETLADVAGTERLVAAGGQSQPRQEEEESGGGSGGGGGEGRLTGPHPDSSPAPYWKHLEHQQRGGQGANMAELLQLHQFVITNSKSSLQKNQKKEHFL